MFNWQFKACCWENKETYQSRTWTAALFLTLGLSTTSIQNLWVNMLWSVNGTAKCIPVILFLPVYFFLISSWLGQDFYIITRPKSYFPYLPLWAYFPGRNIPANSTGKYRGWNLPLNLDGWWDILRSSCLHIKLWSNSTNGTEVRTNKRTNIRTDEQEDENYIPLSINAGV